MELSVGMHSAEWGMGVDNNGIEDKEMEDKPRSLEEEDIPDLQVEQEDIHRHSHMDMEIVNYISPSLYLFPHKIHTFLFILSKHEEYQKGFAFFFQYFHKDCIFISEIVTQHAELQKTNTHTQKMSSGIL